MINYVVLYGEKPVFATMEEAAGYAAEIRNKTGECACVTQTKRDVTHRHAPTIERRATRSI